MAYTIPKKSSANRGPFEYSYRRFDPIEHSTRIEPERPKEPVDEPTYLNDFLAPAKPTHFPVEADPNGKSAHEVGAKVDSGKNRAWLFTAGFANALSRVAEVTTKGAEKYTPNGWVEVPNAKERYMDAFARHMLYLGQGEVYDNGPGGTGCKHIAQMIWNLLAVLELEERNAQASK